MVSSLAPARRHTIADLAGFPDDGKLRELVGGQVVEWEAPTLRLRDLLAELDEDAE